MAEFCTNAGDLSQLRRDCQRGGAEALFSQNVFGSAVASSDYVGKLVPEQAASSVSSSVAQGSSEDRFSLGMASFCAADVDRLLLLIASLRAHCVRPCELIVCVPASSLWCYA